jgi:predicted nucleotidyltransferase
MTGLKNKLKRLINMQVDLELAVLVGSQATDKATSESDWDIAIRWIKQIDSMQSLGKTETLRRMLAKELNVAEGKIDLIDLTTTNLTMKAVVVEEGVVLKGENTLAWNYFMQRTWRELETFYWNKLYGT